MTTGAPIELRPAGDRQLPILIVDTNEKAAAEAIETHYFRSIVAVAVLEDPEYLARLRSLSRLAPRSWLVVIGSREDVEAMNLVHQCGGDALIATPFSVRDLASRLTALSARERPV
jgi:DNA-binding response OmpR family regulator